MRIPLSTYRLQFQRGFGFAEARALVPYLHRLGITDVYASPIFHAHSDNSSGYDIVDPTRLNQSLGQWEDFAELCAGLKRRDMGLLLDIVPNHMSASASNLWWKDVLENGPSSLYASYFDIEWDPPSRSRGGKMLWPILGGPYSDVLERQELTLVYSEEGFAVRYFERVLPLDPVSYGLILQQLQRGLLANGNGDANGPLVPDVAELLAQAHSLPPTSVTEPAAVEQRRTQSADLKRRLWALFDSNPRFHLLLEETLRAFNGDPGDPRSFDLLDELLGQQPYVLSLWRVAREKVNYRRFFDIAELVGVNVEAHEVFAATHSLIFRLVDEGLVTGLRIDHIDGLYDPSEYLRRLRERLPDCFIVVEKILEQGETLCPEWPVAGTTGYDFMNALSSVTVDPNGLAQLTDAYGQMTGQPDFAEVVYRQRKKVIEQLFAGEVHSLSLHLNLLAESDRYAKDASPHDLQAALVEVTACLPVYRTYTRSFQIRPQDSKCVEEAFREARRRNESVSETAWNFVRRVVLLDCPLSLNQEQRAGWKQFVQRWQQFSGPVMAKGKEDTAFYVYNRLISLNEVGGQDRPLPLDEFHRYGETRAKCWPHSLNAGATHDTKRGEDVRARLHVLSRMPEVWMESVKRWQRWNARCKPVLKGNSVPAPNEEYFIYQMLVGTWPIGPDGKDEFLERLQGALLKSWREAKVYTSWSSQDHDYENAVAEFVRTILTPVEENRFLPDFLKLQGRVAAMGACLSLSQTLLRLTMPGVPDIYQGAELWELSMVDPDNRRPVDFAARRVIQNRAEEGKLAGLLKDWESGAVKQFLIQRTLNFRRDHADTFRSGEYIPLAGNGAGADQTIAFARHLGMDWTVVAVPRFPAVGASPARPSSNGQAVAETDLIFPETAPKRWSNLFTGEVVNVSEGGCVAAGSILGRFPVALLTALPG